jgi:hypothetical protein
MHVGICATHAYPASRPPNMTSTCIALSASAYIPILAAAADDDD